MNGTSNIQEERGHIYFLHNFDKSGTMEGRNGATIQILEFMKKEPISEGSTELKLTMNGTTNEEVLRVMIDRMEFLQEKMPCEENAGVIANLRNSLELLNKRTQSRIEKGVEGTQIPA